MSTISSVRPLDASGLTPQEPGASSSRIQELESRVAHLEAEQERFTNALISAGKFLFENPASKMMLAAFPKDMQAKLKEFFNGNR